VLVPLDAIPGGPGVNAIARDSTGAIAMSPPVDAVDLAQSPVHEFQHSKLGALLDVIDLYDLDDRRLFYSPWRADPRPLGAADVGWCG
jgi:HEXXH motif-containing protein